jgi:diguanylate cyclase (GGDEF)-like protein
MKVVMRTFARPDLRMYRRHGVVVYVLAAGLSVLLYGFAPPTQAIGDAGWGVAAIVLLLCVAFAIRLATPSIPVTQRTLSTMSFVGVLLIGVLQWLGGGLGAPYNQLLLLSVFSSAAVHSRPRLVVYLALVSAVAGAPFVYDGWDARVAGATLVELLLLFGIAVISNSWVRQTDEQKADLRQAERAAEAIARSDTLTGLGNRRAFDEMLDQEVARSRRTGVPLSLIVADVDCFKDVNDRFGHLVGDELLRAVSRAIEEAIRRSDRCFRWGGDEFAVVLPDTGLPAARHVEGRMRAAIAASVQSPDGGALTISTAAAELGDEMGPTELLETADAAMLAVKPARRATAA